VHCLFSSRIICTILFSSSSLANPGKCNSALQDHRVPASATAIQAPILYESFRLVERYTLVLRLVRYCPSSKNLVLVVVYHRHVSTWVHSDIVAILSTTIDQRHQGRPCSNTCMAEEQHSDHLPGSEDIAGSGQASDARSHRIPQSILSRS
jgi:hypothetical protein